MELAGYVEELRRHLAAAGEAASAEVRDAAERLSYAIEPSLRLTLLDALTEAAAEVSSQLAAATVEVRLRGRDADLVVSEPAAPTAPPPSPPPPPPRPGPDTEDGMARISLRLPDSLKSRVEQAAAAEGLSVNAWLARAVSRTLDDAEGSVPVRGNRLTGWAR